MGSRLTKLVYNVIDVLEIFGNIICRGFRRIINSVQLL